jgi:SAM-dependent methyltransferase
VSPTPSDARFAGSIPELYDRLLVPLLFESYAADLATRLAARPIARVLELAAGTGAVTRKLAAVLPSTVEIIATDLNQAMLDHAAPQGTARGVTWRQADAQSLPFDDASFDAVVCQFGVMFFPEKWKAYDEARRVLRPGGVFLFNVWDRLEENEFSALTEAAVATLFPQDPPRFLSRTPFGYHDPKVLARDLAAGGFTATPRFTTVTQRSRATSPRDPALGIVQGSPLRNEIEARDPSLLGRATDLAEAAIAERFGAGAVDGKMQAVVVRVER